MTWWGVGRRPPVPPVVEPPRPPEVITGRITVRDVRGTILTQAGAVLVMDDGEEFWGLVDPISHRVTVEIQTQQTHLGWKGWLTLTAPGYQSRRQRMYLPKPEDVTPNLEWGDVPLLLASPFPAESGSLHIDGRIFRTADGQPWTARGVSMFLLAARMALGEDITPQLRWCRRVGVNIVRVFGRVPWPEWPHWNTPEQNPGYWNLLRTFFALLSQHGLRCEWTVFTGRGDLLDQRRILAQTYEVASEFDHVLVEVGNEPHPAPGRNPIPVEAIASGISRRGVLSSYGLYAEGMHGIATLDYASMHTPREEQWVRKARHAQEAMQHIGIPILNGEPMGVAEVREGHRRTTDVAGYVRYAAISTLLGPGLHVHLQCGLEGRMPREDEPVQQAVMEAIRDQVWSKIGPEIQQGSYSADHLTGSPLAAHPLWSYASVRGDQAIGVLVADESIQAAAGWRVVKRWGPADSIGRFERA